MALPSPLTSKQKIAAAFGYICGNATISNQFVRFSAPTLLVRGLAVRRHPCPEKVRECRRCQAAQESVSFCHPHISGKSVSFLNKKWYGKCNTPSIYTQANPHCILNSWSPIRRTENNSAGLETRSDKIRTHKQNWEQFSKNKHALQTQSTSKDKNKISGTDFKKGYMVNFSF